MKKLVLTLAAATCFANGAFAQLHSRSQSFVGIKAGGSASNFVGAQAPYVRYEYGYHGGVFANLALSRPFSLQPEVLYSMKGSQGPTDIDDSSQYLTYIDVPVALRATTGPGFFVETGPQVGFLLKAKANGTGEYVDAKANYRSVDVGYLLGAGYQPKDGGLGIGLRYNGSFLSAFNTNAEGIEAPDKRNSTFQVYLTYSKLKHKKAKKKDTVR